MTRGNFDKSWLKPWSHLSGRRLIPCALFCVMILSGSTSFMIKPAEANHHFSPHHKATIDHIQKCLGKAKKVIEANPDKARDISCNIHFSFTEQEIDRLIAKSVDGAKLSEKWRKRAQKASKYTADTIVNLRSASCLAKVRVKAKFSKNLIKAENGHYQTSPQLVRCDLVSKKNEQKVLTFSFRPKGKFQNQCLKSFTPQMGNIDVGCTFCRHFVVAQLVSSFVNRLGNKMLPGLNAALGRSCY